MEQIEVRIEKWKQRLLDLGKRNRLINFKETKRANLKIIEPGIEELYQALVLDERTLTFPMPVDNDENDFDDDTYDYIQSGDIKSSREISDMIKTLRNLRDTAKASIEEQGVNVLYLVFGFINWKEEGSNSSWIKSPLILVPVSLKLESIASPFKIALHEDEIVINPTLAFQFQNNYGLELPPFDSDSSNLTEYFAQVQSMLPHRQWTVEAEANLGILSFLKINMYKDLDANKDIILGHSIVRALAGHSDATSIVESSPATFDHDRQSRPIDIYQVVDADASQQDAILNSKKGVSFILQGPPGTGKSQTITNIIAEAMADGRKVLFVSEKMAALEVVKHRLSQVGLDHYCLTLHSNKANKKEVLAELRRSFEQKPQQIRAEAIAKLNRLQSERDRINAYDHELHQVCQPLNSSIYEVNGKLAKLRDIPEVIFSIANIEKVDSDQLAQLENIVADLARSAGSMTDSLGNNPWRNSILTTISFELRHKIEANSHKLLPEVERLEKAIQSLCLKLDWPAPISLNQFESLVQLLKLIVAAPGVPDHWILEDNLDQLMARAQALMSDQNRSRSIAETLKADYASGIFDLQADPILVNMNGLIANLQAELNPDTFPTPDSVISQYAQLRNELVSALERLQSATHELSKLDAQTNVGLYSLSADLVKALQVARHLEACGKPEEIWFDSKTLHIVRQLAETARNNQQTIDSLRQELGEVFDKEFLQIDAKGLLTRFKTDYASVFRYLKASYFRDRKSIRSLSLNPAIKLKDDQMIDGLEKVRSVQESVDWFTAHQDRLQNLLGERYFEEFTEWNEIIKALEAFQTIIDNLPGGSLSSEFKNRLLGRRFDYIAIKEIQSSLEQLNVTDLIGILENDLKMPSALDRTKIHARISSIATLLKLLDELAETDLCLKKLARHDQTSHQNFLALKKLSEYQRIEQIFSEQDDELKQIFSTYYTQTHTDWNLTIQSLGWAHDYKSCIQDWDLSDTLKVRFANDPEIRAEAGQAVAEILSVNLPNHETWNWFLTQFSDSASFKALSFVTVADRVRKALTGLYYLEEWVDYQSHRSIMVEHQLSACVEQYETLVVPPDLYVPAFQKQFYRLWLDAICAQKPAIANFRRKTHEDLIDSFRDLDREQLNIAKYRVIAKISDRMPSMDRMMSANDETAILRRELQKQRKIMPLRKLFQEIPNLLLTLKPCLMMSPLSVSQFLHAASYRFDLVIFDEASQVRTEDAIGSMIRGTQVIIAGDNKQMPPSNFFNAAASEDDFDDESEEESYNDTNAYESVLDETSAILARQWLRWHYRSKHEHLIAFSNVKIYDNGLTTFPSSTDKAAHMGVEYIYLENGVYERGKSQNLSEARRVVELIHDHILHRPHRSLGIIAFSMKQQAAITMAVNQFRFSHQEFESFFDEEKDEPFFIKNLENVQGDERDTIIFSIGYGKDSNGKMYMNFGPLNNNGGYRRLNVAITRAKYNVKLVGSIQPTDIDLERTSAEGVKLLRAYIEFAIKGPTVLDQSISVTDVVSCESPFEEAVYDFLADRGYQVSTQVGCSGYRIDMAIKHPTLSGRYVLGIECDGASYHSARTARERDRLRQEILEKIGWKIYRIWSTDWIKDPTTEGLRLIQAIDQAIVSYSDDVLASPDPSNQILESSRKNDFYATDVGEPSEQDLAHVGSVQGQRVETETILDPTDQIYLEEKPVDDTKKGNLQFPIYTETNPWEGYKDDVNRTAEEAAILYVVTHESPIHIELLSQRMAPVYGNQKATAKIVDFVTRNLKHNLKDEIFVRGDFCYQKNAPIQVRIPNGDTGKRLVKYISPEEIGEAILSIVRASIGIQKRDLFVEAARLFGFNRTGGNIETAMNNAFMKLIEQGWLNETEGKVRKGKLQE